MALPRGRREKDGSQQAAKQGRQGRCLTPFALPPCQQMPIGNGSCSSEPSTGEYRSAHRGWVARAAHLPLPGPVLRWGWELALPPSSSSISWEQEAECEQGESWDPSAVKAREAPCSMGCKPLAAFTRE